MRKNLRREGKGLLIFNQVAEVFAAEKALKKTYFCRAVVPPLKFRKGCDLALEIELVEQPAIEKILKAKKLMPLEIVALKEEMSEPLSVVQVTEYGNHTMVKSGNMKLTFDNKTGIVVNVSGGGCPDVPYLHYSLLGKHLSQCPYPKEIGFTLCALMLHRAYEEALRIWEERCSSL